MPGAGRELGFRDVPPPAASADPHAFAGLADLTGLTPTLIINSERDLLRASGELYATQLKQAGVRVECVTEPESDHGQLNKPDDASGARTLGRLKDWLARR